MDWNFKATISATLMIVWALQTCREYCESLIPDVEVDALLEFKANYIEESSQYLLLSWDKNNTPGICESWEGISCTISSDHVQGVELGEFGLTGSLAPHLGNLSFLTTLNLSYNFFTGSIPSQLQGCTALQTLDLIYNELSGAIPSSLSSISSLQMLRLCHNNLSGQIPPAILTNCTSLVTLSLCNNSLNGFILPNFCQQLPSLQYLYLWQNNLMGSIPTGLGNCTTLIRLQLFNNFLTGPIPGEMSALYQIQVLDVGKNNLSGSIPPSFANCTELIQLVLDYNQLTGFIPTELGSLSHIQRLFLSVNNLTGTIPPSLGNCTDLYDFELTINQLTGPIPQELGFLIHLQYLYLPENNFTGSIPSSLANCSSLIRLSLGGNQLIGPFPSELGLLGVVQYLGASENGLTGAIPSSLANCTSMTVLDLSYNELTGTIPREFTRLSTLQELHLQYSNISGVLSNLDFRNFTNLTTLDLQFNRLEGSIISISFANLQKLQSLNLGSNLLTGNIPWQSLAYCTSLFTLDLSNNRLSGGISSDLQDIQMLQFLYLQNNLLGSGLPELGISSHFSLLDVNLSYNLLNGTLPSGLTGPLTTVAFSLDLSHNQFSGSLPTWLGQLQLAKTINFSSNEFVGDIPESLGGCVSLTSLDLSQNHLSGGLPQQLENLAYLTDLDLSQNNLSGVLPSFLGTELHDLKLLNVSFNNFTGSVPTEGVFQHLNTSALLGNPGLCGPILQRECTSSQVSNDGTPWLKTWKGILLLTFCFLVLVIGAVLGASHFCHGQKMVLGDPYIGTGAVTKRRFSAQDLINATDGYSEANIIGQGGLGVVYKGVLSDGTTVAVKKMKDVHDQFHNAFVREMQILSKLRHRNLVQIVGCVVNLDVKALVLTYMGNSSLDRFLESHENHIDKGDHNMQAQRQIGYLELITTVAISIARALVYLHHEYGVPIIHGDVKPGNILLDSDMEPHLADFGLAKLVEREVEAGVSVSSAFAGSIGYMAPEYAHSTRITTKADVYSYGVVALQMATGRKATHIGPNGQSLREWVNSNVPANVEAVMETCLMESMPSDDEEAKAQRQNSVLALLQIGLTCTAEHPKDRPTIAEVLHSLPITIASPPNSPLLKNLAMP